MLKTGYHTSMSFSPNSPKSCLLGICSYNEGDKIRRVIEKFNDFSRYDVLLIDDGSTDGSICALSLDNRIRLMRNERPMGAGYGTRQIIDFAKQYGYAVVIFVSGNDKDDAADVPALIEAVEQGYDFVQGSRYLPGGAYGNMPFYRLLATKYVHPLFFSLFSGMRITDSTNGFRAVRLSLCNDPRIDLAQDWLDQYELEPYLFYKAIRLGYKVKEVAVKKIYPDHKEGYTKMRPFSGWWSILRPLFLLGLGIKK